MTRLSAIARREITVQSFGGGMPVVAGVAVLLLALCLPKPFRTILALPVVLVTPGYCIAMLVFGKTQWLSRRDDIARLALDTVLSLAVWPLLAIVVWCTHEPMTTATIVASFITLCLLTLFRTHIAGRDQLGNGYSLRALSLALSPGKSLGPAIGVAALLMTATGMVAGVAASLPAQQQVPASGVSLTGPSLSAKGPINRVGKDQGSADVDVHNTSGRALHYELVGSVDRGDQWSAVQLDVPAGRESVVHLEGPLPSTGCLARVQISVSSEIDKLAPLVVYFAGNSGSTCNG